jgi:hypothetical protein
VSAVEDIRIKLENRLNVLEQEIESLRSALTALDDQEAADRSPIASAQTDGAPSPSAQADGASSTPPVSPRRRRTPRRPRASAPADDGASQAPEDGAGRPSSAELERLLAETGGLTAVELARRTGTDYGVVLARIRQLERAGEGRR